MQMALLHGSPQEQVCPSICHFKVLSSLYKHLSVNFVKCQIHMQKYTWNCNGWKPHVRVLLCNAQQFCEQGK